MNLSSCSESRGVLRLYPLCSEFTVFPFIGNTDPYCFDASLTLLSALDQRYGTDRYTKRWEKTLNSQPSPSRHRLNPVFPQAKLSSQLTANEYSCEYSVSSSPDGSLNHKLPHRVLIQALSTPVDSAFFNAPATFHQLFRTARVTLIRNQVL